MTVRIRLATDDDRPAIESIVQAAYSPYIPRIGGPPGPMRDDYATRIRNGEVHVATEGERLDGLVVMVAEGDALLVDNLAVDPAAQGRGLGRLLMEFAEATAMAAGRAAIRLYTNEAMTENVSFYRRLGFAETHRVVENGYRRIYMAKALTT